MPYSGPVISARHCSKPGCQRPGVATLTYDYSDSTVVLGPLATVAEPNAYDLCDIHAQHLTAPKGWQVVRLQTHFEPAAPTGDDLLALVDAVRRAAAETPENEAPARPAAQTAVQSMRAGAPERGPFAPSRPRAADDNPLDPESAFAKRRARFQVIDAEGPAPRQD